MSSLPISKPTFSDASPEPRKLRIAYVINSVEGGGAALPVSDVTRVLRAAGAEVRLFALTRRDGRALAPILASGLEAEVRQGGESDHAAAFAWLNTQMRAYRPDYIWTSLTRATLLGQMVAALRGISVVSWQHAAYLKPANRRLLQITQSLSALWVGDSRSVTDFTIARLGVAPDRIMTWPIFAADAEAPQAVPWVAGQTLRLGSLGRLHRVKGFDVLIAAMALLRAEGFRPAVPYDVTISGEGAERAALERCAQEAGIDIIHFAGYAERPRNFLAGCHLYLQPSRSEGLCLAAHEAMQAALPVIVSAVGELSYSVKDEVTGLVVRPGDPRALAAALAALLSNPDRLAAMGQLGRDRVLDRFGADRFNLAGRGIVERLAGRARAIQPNCRTATDRSS